MGKLWAITFARWNNIDEGAFKTYYNGLLSEAELNSLKSKWILPKKGALALTTKQIRDLLKYSISLIKIRGTSQFFEILFRMYGLNCTIDDPAKSGYDGWLKHILTLTKISIMINLTLITFTVVVNVSM